MAKKEMIEALHPDPNKKGATVTKTTYESYRVALLNVIPYTGEGIPFSDLSQAVEPLIDSHLLESTSPGWWVTTVKLDLEARGLIERVETKGRQRLRQINIKMM